jgi:hypothetical protein
MKEFLIKHFSFNPSYIDKLERASDNSWKQTEEGILILNDELFKLFCLENDLDVNTNVVKAIVIDNVFVISEKVTNTYDLKRFTYKTILCI